MFLVIAVLVRPDSRDTTTMSFHFAYQDKVKVIEKVRREANHPTLKDSQILVLKSREGDASPIIVEHWFGENGELDQLSLQGIT